MDDGLLIVACFDTKSMANSCGNCPSEQLLEARAAADGLPTALKAALDRLLQKPSFEAKYMCEWYDVKVRGMLGSGQRDVQEIEMSGRTLRWTEHLEYEAGDKTSAGIVAWLGFERRIGVGQQRSHESRGTQLDGLGLERASSSLDRF